MTGTDLIDGEINFRKPGKLLKIKLKSQKLNCYVRHWKIIKMIVTCRFQFVLLPFPFRV